MNNLGYGEKRQGSGKLAGKAMLRVLGRGLLLKCPGCGTTPLFDGFFSMRLGCTNCSFRFEREQGYFVGAIYINYAVTIVIAMAGFFLLDYFTNLSLRWQMVLWISFAVFFPLLFFRHSRSLWLAIDCLFSPPEARQKSAKVEPISEARKRRKRRD